MTNPNQPKCSSGDDRPAIYGWQRVATQAEVDHFHETGDLPLTETVALIPMYACEIHRLPDDIAWRTHQSGCTAPGAADSDHGICDCNQGPLARTDLESRLAAVVHSLAA